MSRENLPKSGGFRPQLTPGADGAKHSNSAPTNGAALVWGTSDELKLFLCVVNEDNAANALSLLDLQHLSSETPKKFLTVCKGLIADEQCITWESLADECDRQGFSEAAEIARTDLAKVPKRTPKNGWTEEAAKVAEALVENGPILFSTDLALDNALGEIEWLWENFIPMGFVTALVGEQDGGKSTILQAFMHLLLKGGIWPNGQRVEKLPADQKLFWIDTDGNIALFLQRMRTWKMERGRFVFQADPLQELSIDNPKDWRFIETVISEFRPPLVVIDALSGSHSGKENDTDSMKVVMKRLHNLAQKYKIAIVVIHHLNKPPAGIPAYPITIARLRGSSSISQYCRSILALTAPDPTQPEARRLDVIKLNLAKKPTALGYFLTDHGPAWGQAPEPPKQHRAVDDAVEFLREYLADGVRDSDEVSMEAKARNIGNNALKDGRKALQVKAQREGGKDGKWFLSLPKT